MSDTDQNSTKVDLDALTDDQVLELGPDAVQALMEEEIEGNIPEGTSNDEPDDVSDVSNSDDSTPDVGEQEELTDEEPAEESLEQQSADSEQPESNGEVSEENPSEPPEEQKEVEEKPEKDSQDDEPKKETLKVSDQSEAATFMAKITAPFKADGRDMQVRSAEDAIRLMQMGVNYSRRMQEIKPLKAQDAVLKQHGLDDPEKLGYLIDLSQGKPDAIQKLLKENNIDPLDIDTSKELNYQAPRYSADIKQLDFEEAISNTLTQPNGSKLIQDVNEFWDDSSKEALRDEPDIFNKLLAQMDSGVYDRIKDELKYQRALGELSNVPFIQAYDKVGNAMQQAGAFGQPQDQSGGLVSSEERKPEPIDTGTRKAAIKPKTQQPNPNLSSTPRSAPSSDDDVYDEKDYSSMSDEDFLKLAAPG